MRITFGSIFNTLEELFSEILDISITGSYIIVIVLIVRMLFERAPRIVGIWMYGVAIVRLVWPCQLLGANPWCIIPLKVSKGLDGVRELLKTAGINLPAAETDAGKFFLFFATLVWLIGIFVLITRTAVSLFKLRKRIAFSDLNEIDNSTYNVILNRNERPVKAKIYECSKIESPFVLGVLRPTIYLPIGLSKKEKKCVIAHEQIHITSMDHLLKFFLLVIVCIHWFNPLVWLLYYMINGDIEKLCDETAIKRLGVEAKKDYAATLLSVATPGSRLAVAPLAFGENDVKGRIKNVLRYREPRLFPLILVFLVEVIISHLLIGMPMRY